MGEWRKDQSKTTRRYIWGQTRGQLDATWKDFAARMKKLPELAGLQFEKIGSEIHVYRQLKDGEGKAYWTSCLRFVDDDWGYWTVFYRDDERRWRTTHLKDLPLGRAMEAASAFYCEKIKDIC